MSKGHKKPKDPNAPKKNQSSYFIFSNERRPVLEQQNKGVSVVEISKIISAEWKSMNESQKKLYEDRAVKQKQEYLLKFEAYKKTDNYASYQQKVSEWKEQSKKDLAEFEGNVNHLEDKKMNIWNRISTFCEKITHIITAITNIPNNIINLILVFSNHKQIQQISISMFHKLRQFSFMMKDPCNLDEIQECEAKCKQILNTDSYDLPDLFRITMLLYNAIQIPPIFKHSWSDNAYGSHSFGVLLESFIKPLNKWIHLNRNSYKGYYSDIIEEVQGYCDQESNNKIQSWFDTNGTHHYYIFLIGYYYNGDTFPVRVYFNIKTNEMFVYETGDYWDGYVGFMSVKQMFNYSVAQVDKEKLFEEYDLCDLCNFRKIYGCRENYDPGYAEHLFLIDCVAEPGFLDSSNEDFQKVVSLIYEKQ